MTIRRAHRTIAILLAIFIIGHLANHLMILVSPAQHLKVMTALRPFYRPLLIEAPLIALFALQIGLGLRMALKRPWPRRNWAKAQRISGLILAIFLLQHVTAAIATRMLYDQIDTNIYWAASVVSAPPFVWYFAPYYVLGCLSIFVHAAAILQRRRPRIALGTLVAGGVISAAIVVGLLGPHDLPAPYVAYAVGQ